MDSSFAGSCERLATLFHSSLRHTCRYTNFEPVSGNGHGRPIHAYADSSPGLSLPFAWDRCPLFCYCQLILDGPALVLPSGITLSLGRVPCPALPTAPQFALLLAPGGELWAHYMTATKPHFAWPLGWQGGILPTHPPQMICTSMLDRARVASLPTGLAFSATLWLLRLLYLVGQSIPRS